jgi:phenol/toluene 2-monooxygenase (NADH) P1/A1
MNIDLQTVSITPLRQTFDHLAQRFGDKQASRYQEGSYDIQATENLHYRPTWDPEQQLYDQSITRVVMKDWYAIKDPRQFYYNTYTLTRARQQEATEANFSFVESRGLIDRMSDELKTLSQNVLIPLRHAAWGANLNNTFVCGYGYGTTFTQPCMYHAMDHLGIAQYLSRLGLLLGDTEALDEGKQAWMQDPAWQTLRRYTEDCLAVRDPVELFVAQNAALDGLLYPLIYSHIVDDFLSQRGASAVSMLTQFMHDWFEETRKWVDAVLRTIAAESDHNRETVQLWLTQWGQRAQEALLPVVTLALGAQAGEALEEEVAAFSARLKKIGITI